jgi:hypothetical protein
MNLNRRRAGHVRGRHEDEALRAGVLPLPWVGENWCEAAALNLFKGP